MLISHSFEILSIYIAQFFLLYFVSIFNIWYWRFWWEAEIESISIIYGDFDATWDLLLAVSLQFFSDGMADPASNGGLERDIEQVGF